MSNSAFTPSTTTVTNNVPVNVPVVTADKLFVPSIGISGTFSSQKGEYQRAGARMNGRVQLTFATVSAINSPYTLTIPDSLNYDGTNIPVSDEPIVGTFSLWDASASYIEYVGTVHINSATTLKFKAHGQTAFNSSSVPVTIAANDILEIQFSLPIAEWAGSGTTTLATRAVEEYAFNTSTSTTTSDTTSFGYGQNGAVIQNITAALARRVQFQSNIQSSDNISIEISADRITWIPVGGLLNGQVVDTLRFDGANLYGIGLSSTPGFTNQVDVQFGALRTTTASWAGVISTYYWRVRKVSSGAQVGYPVSARNIVGDTSGSVVPTGMLGERIFSQASGISVVASNTIRGLGTLSFQAGTWMIFCSSSLTWSGDPNGSSLILSTTSATSNVFTQLGMTATNVNDVSMSTSSNPANTRFGSINGIVATFTSQTTVFVNIYSFNSVSSSNASYSIWAVRIA